MKAHHVSKKDFTIITISRETHQRLLAVPLARDAVSRVVLNPDGTVSFPVRPDTREALRILHPDPDMAIQLLLGLKTN
jgi:hypothetical protein